MKVLKGGAIKKGCRPCSYLTLDSLVESGQSKYGLLRYVCSFLKNTSLFCLAGFMGAVHVRLNFNLNRFRPLEVRDLNPKSVQE